MLDPSSALIVAQSGVTLNDTPQQVNAKFAQHALKQEVIEIDNEMTTNGYTYMPTASSYANKPTSELVVRTDSSGKRRVYWKKAETESSKTIGSASTGYYAWDPNTGNYEMVISPTEKTSTSQTKADELASINNNLKRSSSTGYTSKEMYLAERQKATISPSDFDNRFGYLLSPEDKKEVTGKSTSSSGSIDDFYNNL
jgi:hypothetical protein